MLKCAMRSSKHASGSGDTVFVLATVIFFETTRLLFRSHQAQDKEEFIQMHTDPEVRRYVGGQAWSLEKARYRFRSQYVGKPSRTYGL
jgi:hypothetical protein